VIVLILWCWQPSLVMAQSLQQVQHIVFIIKENHTYDNYFGQFPGGNGAITGVLRGKTIPLKHAGPLFKDICHSRRCAWQAYDFGKMDKFVFGDAAGLPSYQQYAQSDIPGYWQLASEYVLADNFYSSVLGPSFPNHLMTVGAFTDAADNPDGLPLPNSSDEGWGCDTSGEQVAVVQWGFLQFVPPCFNVQTLPDELDAAGVSWKYYAPQDGDIGYIWSALDAIAHIRSGPDWKKVVPYQQLANDAADGNLPAVSWLIAPYEYSEHPPESVSAGMNWTLQELQALTSSPAWSSTVVFITWDDFGGWYDHVPPPEIDGRGFGFRVPLIIVSPFAKQGFILHDQADFVSVVKFIEERFGLPALGNRDATASDLSGAFNFETDDSAASSSSLTNRAAALNGDSNRSLHSSPLEKNHASAASILPLSD